MKSISEIEKSNCALTGSSGFVLYVDKENGSKYFGSFAANFDATRGYERKWILAAIKA